MTREQILEVIPQKTTVNDGDYTENGLVHCGKCRAPKQSIIEGRARPIPCKCAELEKEQEREAEHRAKIERLRERCLPLAKMRAHTFANADSSKAVNIAQKYVEHWQTMSANGDGLIFFGTVGTGKSFSAHCIANALIDMGISVLYLSAADMVAEFGNNTARADYIKKICSAPLLIVDDLGAESGTDYSRSLLCRLIDARTESGKPIIITTNYTSEEMKATQDNQLRRIFDRLRCCTPVQCNGDSRRKEQGKARHERAVTLLLD